MGNGKQSVYGLQMLNIINNYYYESMKDKLHNTIVGIIRDDIKKAFDNLSNNQKIWIKRHLDAPHIVDVSLDINQFKTIQVWQITKNDIDEKSPNVISYNPATHNYGIITELSSGVKWYMGDYGSFVDAYMAL